MPHFLVTRQVTTEQVVLIEGSSASEAEEKGWNTEEGHIQYEAPVEVTDVTEVEGDAD